MHTNIKRTKMPACKFALEHTVLRPWANGWCCRCQFSMATPQAPNARKTMYVVLHSMHDRWSGQCTFFRHRKCCGLFFSCWNDSLHAQIRAIQKSTNAAEAPDLKPQVNTTSAFAAQACPWQRACWVMLWFYILKSQCKVWGEGGSDRPVYCPTHQNLLHRLADIRHIYYIYMRKRAMTTLASITCSFYNEFSNHRRISILRLCNVSKMCARKVTWSQGDLQTRSLMMTTEKQVQSMWFRS